jgi:hypothetical protein
LPSSDGGAPDAPAAPADATPDRPPADTRPPDTATFGLDAAPPRLDSAPAPPADTASPPADVHPPTTVDYTFEGSPDGWVDLRWDWFTPKATQMILRASTVEHLQGTQSLEIPINHNGSMDWPTVGIRKMFMDQLPPGATITYHIWFPDNGSIFGVQPYVLFYRVTDLDQNPRWGGVQNIIVSPAITPGQWSTVTHRVPDDMDTTRGVQEVGMEWRTNGAKTVKVYMDDIYWNAP